MKNKFALFAAVGILAAAGSLCAQPRLKYAAIVMRHGVRAPTWEPARLNEYSAEPWPDFEVPPGNLTPHGRALIEILGAYYRDWLIGEGLLKPEGCADSGKIYIWTDTDERTVETGRAMSRSILHDCEIPIHSRGSRRDPLFSGAAAADPKLAAESIHARIGGDFEQLLSKHRAAVDKLQYVLDGGQRTAHKLIEAPAEAESSLAKSADPPGFLAIGSTMSENLLLEYTNGMDGKTLGWGRLTKEILFQTLELHNVYADLTRRTSYIARRRGSNLLAHVLASLDQAASGRPVPGALGPTGTTLLILSGHDTNLSNLSGMLDLSWNLPGYQSDETPPGGALIFKLWQDSTHSNLTFQLEYVAASLDQMRRAERLTKATPPLKQSLSLPACGGASGCTWEKFRSLAAKTIDASATDFHFR